MLRSPQDIPDGGEFLPVPVAIDEADEDLKDKEADLSILHEGCREQPVQEDTGKCREHVTALEAHRDLQASKKNGGNVTVSLQRVTLFQFKSIPSCSIPPGPCKKALFAAMPAAENPQVL